MFVPCAIAVIFCAWKIYKNERKNYETTYARNPDDSGLAFYGAVPILMALIVLMVLGTTLGFCLFLSGKIIAHL